MEVESPHRRWSKKHELDKVSLFMLTPRLLLQLLKRPGNYASIVVDAASGESVPAVSLCCTH